MTIRDIAKLASVSVTTVSKVINNKDEHLKKETRERVQQIIKENNYVPFAQQRASQSRYSLLLGVLYSTDSNPLLLDAIIRCVRSRGYSSLVYSVAAVEEAERDLAAIYSHNVDGIVCYAGGLTSVLTHQLINSEKPYITIDFSQPPSEINIVFPYEEYARVAVKSLRQAGHQRIGCVMDCGLPETKILLNGFHTGMLEQKLEIHSDNIFDWPGEHSRFYPFLERYKALLCYDENVAVQVHDTVEHFNMRVPADVSIVIPGASNSFTPVRSLSMVESSYKELGEFCVNTLVNKIENLPLGTSPFANIPVLKNEEHIGIPQAAVHDKIVTVGTSNMDTFCIMERLPSLGETIEMDHCLMLPGGKGMNQALAAAKLGADSWLISSVGKDYDGSKIYEYLKKNSIHIDGVFIKPTAPTGRAYIQIQKNGESHISIFNAANHELSKEDLDNQEALFANAAFVLLQTELRQELAVHAADIAHRNEAKVILKPCAISKLDEALLKRVDILVPNKKEAAALLPDLTSVEDRARYFYDLGISTVIITLGINGCFLKDKDHELYFPAANIKTVDTTGAADEFISTLAVYLSRGKNIATAIRYATCAAGLMTTQYGASQALVERDVLEVFVAGQLKNEISQKD